jgi:hypothetical protein
MQLQTNAASSSFAKDRFLIVRQKLYLFFSASSFSRIVDLSLPNRLRRSSSDIASEFKCEEYGPSKRHRERNSVQGIVTTIRVPSLSLLFRVLRNSSITDTEQHNRLKKGTQVRQFRHNICSYVDNHRSYCYWNGRASSCTRRRKRPSVNPMLMQVDET